MEKKQKASLIFGAAGLVALAFMFGSNKKTGKSLDSAYLPKKQAQLNNIGLLLDAMKAKGITNPNSKTGLLTIVSKESEFIPRRENLNYTSAQIQKVFKVSKDTADKLAHNPEALGNYMYGGKGGNKPNDGYKYRGGAFNQITFYDDYFLLGKQLGIDLAGNPDLIDDPKVAAQATVQDFINRFDKGLHLGKLAQYNSTGINDFKNLRDSVEAFYHANAGWGHSKAFLEADVTGGRKKALARMNSIHDLVSKVA